MKKLLSKITSSNLKVKIIVSMSVIVLIGVVTTAIVILTNNRHIETTNDKNVVTTTGSKTDAGDTTLNNNDNVSVGDNNKTPDVQAEQNGSNASPKTTDSPDPTPQPTATPQPSKTSSSSTPKPTKAPSTPKPTKAPTKPTQPTTPTSTRPVGYSKELTDGENGYASYNNFGVTSHVSIFNNILMDVATGKSSISEAKSKLMAMEDWSDTCNQNKGTGIYTIESANIKVFTTTTDTAQGIYREMVYGGYVMGGSYGYRIVMHNEDGTNSVYNLSILMTVFIPSN